MGSDNRRQLVIHQSCGLRRESRIGVDFAKCFDPRDRDENVDLDSVLIHDFKAGLNVYERWPAFVHRSQGKCVPFLLLDKFEKLQWRKVGMSIYSGFARAGICFRLR